MKKQDLTAVGPNGHGTSAKSVLSHRPRGPRFKLRRGRLVSVEDIAGPSTSDGPLLVERRGKLVRDSTSHSTSTQAPPAAANEASGADAAKVGFGDAAIITLFVISLMMPASQSLGSLRLTPYLSMLLIGMAPMVLIWIRRNRTPMMPSDWLVLSFCFWASTALTLSGGFTQSLEAIGVLFLQTFGAYLAGRLLVRNPASMRLLLRVLVGALLLMLPLIIFEALTGQKPLLKLGTLFGQPLAAADPATRLGLHRAQGAFEHPILMGIFCASLVSVAFYTFRDSRFRLMRWIGAPVSTLCAIFSVSTGALLTLNIQFGLMLWSRALRALRHRWAMLAGLVVMAYVAVDLIATKSPFHTFVHWATFSTRSSYNRILIWNYGSAEVLRHPLFGIGFDEWERPSFMSTSMDNFWLIMAVRYGIPAFALLLSSICLILYRMSKVEYASNELVFIRRGVTFSIIATMVSITSVHLWNATYVWFMFLVGASAWLANPVWAPSIEKGKNSEGSTRE